MREGYYSIVNGYKAPFLDIDATEKVGDDRYKAETKFSDLYSLFLFDRDLRELTFHYLLRVEALVRTVCSYTFSEAHREPDAYLNQSNYASKDEYERFGLKGYRYNLAKLHGELFRKATGNNREFVEHYRQNHDNVPLWVLANDLTFGNVEHFFNLMKPSEQIAVCKRIVDATGHTGGKQGFFEASEMRIGLDAIVKFRNICAHDERLYCAKVGKRRGTDYVHLLAYLRRYLTDDEMSAMIISVNALVEKYSWESEMISHLLDKMGFAKISK